MNNLWKPAALAAYCNQGRSGSSLVDSGMFGRTATLSANGSWSQIAGHNDRWAIHTAGTIPGDVPLDASWSSHGNSLTVTAWICPDEFGAFQGIAGIRESNNTGFYFRLNNTSNPSIRVTNFSGTDRTASLLGDVLPGEWLHVALRFADDKLTIFSDGQVIHNGTNTYDPLPTTGRVVLWGIPVGGNNVQPLGGKGADLCFWQYLSDDEIKWLANPNNNVLLPSISRGFPLSRLVN